MIGNCEVCDSHGRITRGLCDKHYARLQRNGSTRAKRRYLKGTGYERVMARLEPDGDCLLFIGARTAFGYGQVRVDGKIVHAHRLVLEHHAGPSDGRYALHSCDNPSCCNIEHLRWGTLSDNALDACDRGRCVHAVLGRDCS